MFTLRLRLQMKPAVISSSAAAGAEAIRDLTRSERPAAAGEDELSFLDNFNVSSTSSRMQTARPDQSLRAFQANQPEVQTALPNPRDELNQHLANAQIALSNASQTLNLIQHGEGVNYPVARAQLQENIAQARASLREATHPHGQAGLPAHYHLRTAENTRGPSVAHLQHQLRDLERRSRNLAADVHAQPIVRQEAAAPSLETGDSMTFTEAEIAEINREIIASGLPAETRPQSVDALMDRVVGSAQNPAEPRTPAPAVQQAAPAAPVAPVAVPSAPQTPAIPGATSTVIDTARGHLRLAAGRSVHPEAQENYRNQARDCINAALSDLDRFQTTNHLSENDTVLFDNQPTTIRQLRSEWTGLRP